jgi:hypothetical protein
MLGNYATWASRSWGPEGCGFDPTSISGDRIRGRKTAPSTSFVAHAMLLEVNNVQLRDVLLRLDAPERNAIRRVLIRDQEETTRKPSSAGTRLVPLSTLWPRYPPT